MSKPKSLVVNMSEQDIIIKPSMLLVEDPNKLVTYKSKKQYFIKLKYKAWDEEKRFFPFHKPFINQDGQLVIGWAYIEKKDSMNFAWILEDGRYIGIYRNMNQRGNDYHLDGWSEEKFAFRLNQGANLFRVFPEQRMFYFGRLSTLALVLNPLYLIVMLFFLNIVKYTGDSTVERFLMFIFMNTVAGLMLTYSFVHSNELTVVLWAIGSIVVLSFHIWAYLIVLRENFKT